MLLPAAAIIREKGIHGATVDDLVEAVGVTRGKLYYHIRLKDGLLFWIHESLTNEGLRRWTKLVAHSEEPATETLRAMIREHCSVIRDYYDCVAVVNEEIKYLPAEAREQIRHKRSEYQDLLEVVLHRGISRGEFRDVPVHNSASFILGTLNSMYRWFSPQGRLTSDEVADTAWQLVLRGLRTAS
jgi:AcrR family transcriptional regulator